MGNMFQKQGIRSSSAVPNGMIKNVVEMHDATIAIAGCTQYDIPPVFCLKDADGKMRPLYPCRALATGSTTTQTLASEAIAKLYDSTSAGLADNPEWDGELGFIDAGVGTIITETSGAAVVTFVSRSTAAITTSGTPDLTVESGLDLMTVGGFTTANTLNECGFIMNPKHLDKNEDLATDWNAAVMFSGTIDYSKLNADAKAVVDAAFTAPSFFVGFLSKFQFINRES
jgi:hypothetical protein